MTNLFRITNNNGEEQKEAITITPDNTYYKIYNEFLQQEFFTTIEENEDFIPMNTGTEIILILTRCEDDDPIEEEDVFEVMQDMIYQRA
jgi:dsDNA-specific endonuclease/ATPase MutS2